MQPRPKESPGRLMHSQQRSDCIRYLVNLNQNLLKDPGWRLFCQCLQAIFGLGVSLVLLHRRILAMLVPICRLDGRRTLRAGGGELDWGCGCDGCNDRQRRNVDDCQACAFRLPVSRRTLASATVATAAATCSTGAVADSVRQTIANATMLTRQLPRRLSISGNISLYLLPPASGSMASRKT
jgi:hypothetical protein